MVKEQKSFDQIRAKAFHYREQKKQAPKKGPAIETTIQ
jgi:hypothetical protein